ncbi:MAG: hypothetical protein ACK4OM_02510 [Alphaproteobacteria bacterium]
MKYRAFTILELSISLIIITLLIVIMTTAVSLISSAENRKVISEYNMFQTAIINFKLQYNQLPGDMINASSYFSSSGCTGTAGTAGTCNGNANGIIEYSGSTTSDESLRAWQHLTLSGFLGNTYTGTRSSANVNTIGTNVPNSYIKQAGWAFQNIECYTNNIINSLIFGAYNSSSLNDFPVLTTRDAYFIDSKIDDGSARTGNIHGLYSDDSLGNYCTAASSVNILACVQNNSNTTTDVAKSGYYYINKEDGKLRCALQFLF